MWWVGLATSTRYAPWSRKTGSSAITFFLSCGNPTAFTPWTEGCVRQPSRSCWIIACMCIILASHFRSSLHLDSLPGGVLLGWLSLQYVRAHLLSLPGATHDQICALLADDCHGCLQSALEHEGIPSSTGTINT